MKVNLRASALLLFVTAPLFYPAVRCFADDIFFVSGDLEQVAPNGLSYASANPMAERSWLSYLQDAYVYTGESTFRGPGFYIQDLDGAYRPYGYKDILPVIETLKMKGYRIRTKSRVTARDLLQIVASPETVAVFYVGHSRAAVDPLSRRLDFNDIRLTTYERGKVVRMTEEIADRAKLGLKAPYEPGAKLRLFYSGACYSALCEAGVRAALELPASVQFVTAAGTQISNASIVAQSFAHQIRNWADDLPMAEGHERPGCLRRALDRLGWR